MRLYSLVSSNSGRSSESERVFDKILNNFPNNLLDDSIRLIFESEKVL